ncbi:MFS transporter [Sphingomonas sp. SUN039]|uniref:MFS transporter n=1 Tax=Sphingomonas sp. SUN039 TaxID=2937787 RepID=UPI0021645F42|nr:MFS transporter [Sphingomonas sp. SUN039]UVO54554.1 MFS transporter [Sphingomonas sp. SUN039]
MTSAEHRVPFRTKVAYGIGAIAYGIKENGYTTFLLLFYNQVVGLPAGTVGLIVAAALIFDALLDPLVGFLSDRTHTRWGRRHPWLYASALPIGLSWALLWNPPQGSEAMILGWLGVVAVFTRAAITMNEVPSLAIAPEMTPDYHERTAVLRYRYLFGWAGGLMMLMLAYGVFLPVMSGPAALAGFSNYGLFGAVVMTLTVLISAIGTHRAQAKPPPARIAPQPASETVRQLRETLGNRAFLILMLAGLFGYVNQGVGFAISQYNLNYVWLLKGVQLQLYALSLFGGMVAMFVAVMPLVRLLGKIRASMVLAVGSALFVCSTYVLRLLGLFPEVGSPAMLPAFLVLNTIGTALGIGALMIGASMMSDVVEASEEQTGRREEGLFFAGTLLMQKASTALGIGIAGLILQWAEFPASARAGQVPTEILDSYTLAFVFVTLALGALSALAVRRFPFGEAEHRARVAKLAVASDN